MRAQLVTCPRSAFYRFFHHIDFATPSVHLHAGAAYAKGMEVTRKLFYSGQADARTAIAEGLRALWLAYGDFECPETEAKTALRMAGAFEFYFANWPLESDYVKPHMVSGQPTVEFNFVLPIPEVAHPETGEPILYCGRFDMLGNYNGTLFIEDDKTTKQLGPTWPNKWRLRSQFTGYCWGARQYGFPVAGAIIRGVSILKTKYDKAEAIVYRPQHMVDAWYDQLVRDLHRAIDMWRAGHFDASFADACDSYGGCNFSKVCESNNPQSWLNGPDFTQRIWDPAHNGDNF